MNTAIQSKCIWQLGQQKWAPGGMCYHGRTIPRPLSEIKIEKNISGRMLHDPGTFTITETHMIGRPKIQTACYRDLKNRNRDQAGKMKNNGKMERKFGVRAEYRQIEEDFAQHHQIQIRDLPTQRAWISLAPSRICFFHMGNTGSKYFNNIQPSEKENDLGEQMPCVQK